MKLHRAGFTLIELLVVITIIAILAALAFAVAPGMIKRAHQTQSLNNLRQVATGLTLYAADNDGRYPPRQGDGDGKDRWPKLVHSYLQDIRVLAAPDDPTNFLKTNMNPLDNSVNNTSYIMNGGLDPSGDGSAGSESKPLVLAGIEAPSKTILLGIIFNDPNFYLDVKNGDQSLIKPDLFGTSNSYVFMDGSARAMEAREYRELNTQNGQEAYLWLINKSASAGN